jgi:hypothetical protein
VLFFCLAIAAAQDDSEYDVSYLCPIWFSFIVCVIDTHLTHMHAFHWFYAHHCCSQEVEGGWQAKVRHVGEMLFRGTLACARASVPLKTNSPSRVHLYPWKLTRHRSPCNIANTFICLWSRGADVLRLHSQEGADSADSSIVLSAKPYRRHFQLCHTLLLLVNQIQI